MVRSVGRALLTGLVFSLPLAAVANPLANSDQQSLEALALRLRASKPVEQQVEFAKQFFGTDPWASTPEGKATLPASIAELVFSGAVGVANEDPGRPKVGWLWSPAHSWYGLTVPTAKVIMPNIDNVFRLIPVDGQSHYRITAKPTGPIPTQETLQLLPGLPGQAHGSTVIQELLDTDIHTEADGSFTLTVGPEPAANLPNHIGTKPESRFILVRDTILDWQTECPYKIEVTRLDGPPLVPPEREPALAEKAAKLVQQTLTQVRDFKESWFKPPANNLPAPKVREGGRWGLSTSGHFQLADDEALVLTLDPVGAKYLSVQLANGWLGSLDYRHRTASLNIAQVERNEDGTVTLIVASRDPGYRNWLDTTGLHVGAMFVRWQKLPDQAGDASQAVRTVKLVKLTDLATSLPSGASKFTPEQRRAQQEARAAGYARRFSQNDR
jgi:hypothetical protein